VLSLPAWTGQRHGLSKRFAVMLGDRPISSAESFQNILQAGFSVKRAHKRLPLDRSFSTPGIWDKLLELVRFIARDGDYLLDFGGAYA
jgi:hypothetical protein